MRRPVKSFVTEYRGGTRRQAGQGQSAKIDFLKVDPDAPESRAASPASSDGRSWPSAPEDGYEAALRAADALFSGGRQPAPRVDASAADETAEAAAPGGGRVLRVLDEPPSEEMLRLEAEFAPKRRGRKPGSKNKPKLPVPALADVGVSGAQSASDAWAREPWASDAWAREPWASRPSASKPLARDPWASAPPTAASETPARPAVPAATTQPAVTVGQANGVLVGAGALRGERYAWVRTRLKPGEQWKRRLPKVAW